VIHSEPFRRLEGALESLAASGVMDTDDSTAASSQIAPVLKSS
jgi:hypothetical protein